MTASMTKAEAAQRANYHYMADVMRRLEWDIHHQLRTEGRIPEAWHAIAQEEFEPGTERVTIRLDRDVVKFFRAMGPRWQTRANRVLRAFVLAKAAGLVRGAETMEYLRTAKDEWDRPRPMWGEVQAGYEATMGEDGGRLMRSDDGPAVPMGRDRKTPREVLDEWDVRGSADGVRMEDVEM